MNTRCAEHRPPPPDPRWDRPTKTRPPHRQRRYTEPRLSLIASASDVLEVLGPAQANYGVTGFG